MEPRTRESVKGYRFLSFPRNLSNKCEKQLLDTRVDALKYASKKLDHKAAEAKSKIVKPVEKIIIPPEKREEILNELRQVL